MIIHPDISAFTQGTVKLLRWAANGIWAWRYELLVTALVGLGIYVVTTYYWVDLVHPYWVDPDGG